jgi:pyridoxine 5-phosphate synthase
MLKLGVNIDHVATVRQARLGLEPSPMKAAEQCEVAGCFGITAHLREDRRHIIDSDIVALAQQVEKLNMEMAVTDEMIEIALENKPNSVCLVPEKREELTTEGGLDVVGMEGKLAEAIPRFQKNGILVSLFIDPEEAQIRMAASLGAEYIELHTGTFANASGDEQLAELERLVQGAELAHSLGLKVNAGHGIDYLNIELIKKIPHLIELNIGHSIISRAVFVGMKTAVKEMLALMEDYTG